MAAAALRIVVSGSRWLAALGLLGLGFWLSYRVEFRYTWPMSISLLIILGLVIHDITLIRASRPRPVTEGVALSATEHHALWTVVRQVSGSVGVSPPDFIYLGLDAPPVAQVSRFRRGLRRKRILALGVAPLCVLSTEQWRAALTQSLMMQESGPFYERWLLRGQRRVERSWESLPDDKRRGLLGWLRRRPLYGHTRLARPVCHRRQLAADRSSAEITSAYDARLAMLRTPETELAWWQYWHVYVMGGSGILRRPIDVVAGFRQFLMSVGIPDLPPSAPTRTDCAFPSLEGRLAALSEHSLASSDAPAVPDREFAAAIDLLAGSPSLVELELAWFEGIGLTPLTWDELAHAVGARECRQRAAWVFDELAARGHDPTLLGLLGDLADGGRRLQGLLAERADSDDDTDPVHDPLSIATSLVGDAVAAGLIEASGARFVMHWAEPPGLIGTDGTIMNPWAMAEAAVGDHEEASRLHQWLALHGVPGAYRTLPPGSDLGRTVMDADPVILASACIHNSWRVRLVYVLDTGLVVLRPRLSDDIVGSLSVYGGEPGATMLRRWSGAKSNDLISHKRSTYIDWTEVRAVKVTIHDRSLRLVLEHVDGKSIKLRGSRLSAFEGHFVGQLARLLGDRLSVT